jgi:oligopeptide transport system ATP-binding protein
VPIWLKPRAGESMASPTSAQELEAASRDDVLLRVKGLTMHFPLPRWFYQPRVVVRAVDGIDLSVRRGETLSLVGESGSGKTTAGRAIMQLYKPTAGSVEFDGVELTRLPPGQMRRMRRRMQMIFQDPYASLNPRMNVAQIVGEALEIHDLARGHEKIARVHDLLQRVGLNPYFANRYPHEFSGGQRQRIGVARALAVNPELIVADEPISALDVSIQAQLINLIEELQTELGLTILLVAHDLAVVEHISDRVAVMYLGRVVEFASRASLYQAPHHPYTVALLSAVPVPDPDVEAKRRPIVLEGDIPSPVSPPSGCRFHTRCWLYEQLGRPEECRVDDPPARDVGNGHLASCHFAEKVPGASATRSAVVAIREADRRVGAT